MSIVLLYAPTILNGWSRRSAASRTDVPELAHAVEVLARALEMMCEYMNWLKRREALQITDLSDFNKTKYWIQQAEEAVKNE